MLRPLLLVAVGGLSRCRRCCCCVCVEWVGERPVIAVLLLLLPLCAGVEWVASVPAATEDRSRAPEESPDAGSQCAEHATRAAAA
jgi:hypothetical protein